MNDLNSMIDNMISWAKERLGNPDYAGWCLSFKVRIDDYLEVEKLTAMTGDHPKYLGWVPLSRVLAQRPE